MTMLREKISAYLNEYVAAQRSGDFSQIISQTMQFVIFIPTHALHACLQAVDTFQQEIAKGAPLTNRTELLQLLTPVFGTDDGTWFADQLITTSEAIVEIQIAQMQSKLSNTNMSEQIDLLLRRANLHKDKKYTHPTLINILQSNKDAIKNARLQLAVLNGENILNPGLREAIMRNPGIQFGQALASSTTIPFQIDCMLLIAYLVHNQAVPVEQLRKIEFIFEIAFGKDLGREIIIACSQNAAELQHTLQAFEYRISTTSSTCRPSMRV